MKRYLIFAGRHYYPSGGIDDLIADCDTIEDCKKAWNDKIMEYYTEGYGPLEEYLDYERGHTWAHICDTETKQKVWTQ